MTGQPEVNTALIIIDGDLYDVWSAMLVSAAPGVKISRADPSIFVSDKQVIETLNKRYDCILLASKLPAFSSVRLAELAHQLNSPTKLILISRNNADPEATGRLFHAFIPVEKLSSDRLSEALKKDRVKVDSEELPRLIETVINTSFYFSNLANKLLYGAEAPSSASPEITYIDYIKLIKRGLETQRREQRRQQELERPRTPSRAAPAITDKHRAPHTLLLVQSLGALVAGLSLAFMGLYAMQGDTTVDLFGQKITSKSAGVIAIFIGAVLIVLMSRRILKTLDLMLR